MGSFTTVLTTRRVIDIVQDPPRIPDPTQAGRDKCGPGAAPDDPCGEEHLVEFYESEPFLHATVAGFVVSALREHDAAIVVASAEHREAFALAIRAGGIDLDAAVEEGRYLALDAAETLAKLMVGGAPDPTRFAEVLGSAMDFAADNGREVRVYGEMVALLWADGDVSSTIALEKLWNDLAAVRRFSLLCAYPMHGFDEDVGAVFKQICALHSTVIPAESYTPFIDADEQQRLIAELQQKRIELDRLRQKYDRLLESSCVDSLTGLANRGTFDLHLEREWGLAHREGIDSFVVFADLDGFKELNDSRGHAVGDDALCEFAKSLRIAARGTDIQARIGGDEFGALMIRCDERAVHAFASRLREAMTAPISAVLGSLRVSIGHASLLRATSAAKALEAADLAMLGEKRSTRRRGAPG